MCPAESRVSAVDHRGDSGFQTISGTTVPKENQFTSTVDRVYPKE